MTEEGRPRRKTHYDLLGVQRTATKEEIREAYKELARIYHPDSHFFDEIVPDAGPSSSQVDVFKEITDAYNTLNNETKRAEYDQSLPKDLPEWEGEENEIWYTEHRVNRSTNQYEEKSQLFTWGSFGTVEPITKAKSAFDDPNIYHVTSMSEMIHAKRSIWQKLWLILRGRR